jgi:hypothetical protein
MDAWPTVLRIGNGVAKRLADVKFWQILLQKSVALSCEA